MTGFEEPETPAPSSSAATPTPAETEDAAAEVDDRRAAALIVGVAATVAFVTLRLIVALGGRDPLAVDIWFRQLMEATQSNAGVATAWVPAVVGGTVGMPIIAAAIAGLFLWRGRPWDAANVAIAIVTVTAIGAPLAFFIGRGRPDDSLAETMATSFPSGHTAVATTLVVTLALILRRWYVWVGGAAWVVLMMWSRAYLRAHWLSDVVGGMLEGIAVATIVWCAVEAFRDRRALRSEQAASLHHTE